MALPTLRQLIGLASFVRLIRENTISTVTDAAYDLPIIPWRVFWRQMLTVNHPDGVRHVLVDNAENYVKSRLARRLLEPGLGQGLVTAEGEVWRHHRAIMQPGFKRIQRYAPVVGEEAASMAANWARLPPGQVIDAAAEMMHLTLIIIARAMFSFDTRDEVNRIEESVARYQTGVRIGLADLLGLPEWLPSGSRAGARKALSGMDGVISRLLARPAPMPSDGEAEDSDLLSLLLAARAAGEINDRELRDEVVTIFTAGHETTAQALTWTWYLLAQHPEAEAKLHDELDRVLGGRVPQFEDYADLPYARMVVEEAMRLYPPAHTISREALGPDTIMGHALPRGGLVIIMPWIIHRHRALWEDPLRFDPERFAPERAAGRPRYAYLPFGAGPRICIAASLATMEATLILATLAQRFRLRLVEGQSIEPVGLITLRPKDGLKVRIEARKGGPALSLVG